VKAIEITEKSDKIKLNPKKIKEDER